MDVLIESTTSFEKDLANLSEDEQTAAVKKINDCANLFATIRIITKKCDNYN